MAISLKEFRENYPVYNNIPDQELVDKMHQKFYSDMPKQDFYSRIGFNPSANNESSLLDNVSSLLPKPQMLGMNIATGLMSLGAKNPEQRELIKNIPQALTGTQPTFMQKMAQGIGEYAPFGAAAPESLLGQTVAGGAYGLATGNPNESNLLGFLPQGKIGKGIESALINALTHGVVSGIDKLRPSKLFRGTLTPEQLKSNVAAAGETPTGLGDVIQSPRLKRLYENFLTKMFFSGANEKMLESGLAVKNKAQDIMEHLGSGNQEDALDQLNEKLINKYETHQENKNNLYREFENIAEQTKEKPQLTNFRDALRKNKDSLDKLSILRGDPLNSGLFDKISSFTGALDSPSLSTVKRLAEVPDIDIIKDPLTGQSYSTPTSKRIMQDVTVNNNVPPSYGSGSSALGTSGVIDYYNPSYKEGNFLSAALIRAANLAQHNPAERAVSGVYRSLGNALKKDVKESVSNSNNPRMINAFNQAEENYQNNFSGFLDKDIFKFLGNTEKSDKLAASFIKKQEPKKLEKLTSLLQGQEKDQLAYAYLGNALDNEGNLNLAKFSTLIEKLSPKQFKNLIPDPILRKQIKNFNKLYKMNQKSVSIVQNPETGQKNLDILPGVMVQAGTAAAGGKLGKVAGAVTGFLAPGLISKPLVNWLTSPEARKNLVKAMIEGKKIDPRILQSLQASMQGLQNQ